MTEAGRLKAADGSDAWGARASLTQQLRGHPHHKALAAASWVTPTLEESRSSPTRGRMPPAWAMATLLSLFTPRYLPKRKRTDQSG